MKKTLIVTLALISLSNAELFTEKFDTGVVKSKINYVDGSRTDTAEGVKDGLEKVFYDTSELAYTVNNNKNKRDGLMTWYDRDGNVLEKIYFKNGKRDGENKIFFANGKLRITVKYVDDKKEGLEKYYFDDGKLASEVNYLHNRKNGIQKEYNEDGSINNEVTYKNGYKEGYKKWYDKNKKVTHKEFYKMDRPINLMKKVQKKEKEVTVDALKGLNFNPNDRKVK